MMIYGLYQSAAGMMTNEYRQNVIANNLANADTVGFKQELAVFAERVPAARAGRRHGPSAPDLAGLTGGLWLGRTHTDFSQGGLVRTDHPTDVALDGRGFLVVQVDDRPLYTRDGRLVMAADGVLRAATDGAPVLGVGGRPILLDPHGGRIAIDEEGRVLQNGVPRGQLAVVDFADYRGLRHAGAGRFDADDTRPVPAGARLRSGFLESSGVAPIRELANMIETSRAYQLNARLLSLQDQSAARLIRAVARR